MSVWPGIFPASNGGELGGFELAANEFLTVTLPDGYSGRIWPRTGCDESGNCETGTCQGGINCTSPAAAGPTLAQFTIDGYVMVHSATHIYAHAAMGLMYMRHTLG